MFKAVKTYFENEKLKKENRHLQMFLEATEKELMFRVNEYRSLLGKVEIQRQKIENLDRCLYNSSKTIKKILDVAQENSYGNSDYKVQKIIELAKSENVTSPIK